MSELPAVVHRPARARGDPGERPIGDLADPIHGPTGHPAGPAECPAGDLAGPLHRPVEVLVIRLMVVLADRVAVRGAEVVGRVGVVG